MVNVSVASLAADNSPKIGMTGGGSATSQGVNKRNTSNVSNAFVSNFAAATHKRSLSINRRNSEGYMSQSDADEGS